MADRLVVALAGDNYTPVSSGANCVGRQLVGVEGFSPTLVARTVPGCASSRAGTRPFRTGSREARSEARSIVSGRTGNANPRSNERQSLVDTKGFGKPPILKRESSKFTEWLRKTTRFLMASCGSAFRSVIEWVEDQDNVITHEALDRQFGSIGAEPIEDVQEKERIGSRCTSGVDRQ